MPSKAPERVRLTVRHDFKASHSLEGFEVPHHHLWRVMVTFETRFPMSGDRVIDMLEAESLLSRALQPLQGSFLNASLGMSPTSENLCSWLWSRLPDSVCAASVTLCDLEGREFGKAELLL